MIEKNTHSKIIGYITWVIGFMGAHRFYYGKPITGTIWFFTCGLFFIGWIIDFFLIPSQYEPCGLTDFIAQLFGNIPIVHHIGTFNFI